MHKALKNLSDEEGSNSSKYRGMEIDTKRSTELTQISRNQ